MSADKRAKALKLLEAMVQPCEHQQKSGEHEWRKCRRCLAHQEAEKAHGTELLAVLLAELSTPPSSSAGAGTPTKEGTTRMDNLTPIETPQPAPTNEMVCFWKEDEDGVWQTACDQAFVFIDSGPKENHMRFCCYCGASLHAVPASDMRVEDGV